MRRGRLGLWLAVAVAIASAVGGASASGARWEVTLRLAPTEVELAAASEHVRIELKL
jgi:hypothetical protein